MEIIIAGAGRVGFRLAKTLSRQHDVTVLDNNKDALERVQETMDVLVVAGNVEDPATFQPFHGKEVDLFIAVTDSDEVNIVSCLIADECIRAKQKIIRLRNDFFAKSSIAQKFGITEAVFPIMRTATSVKSLLKHPNANSVKGINASPFKLIAIRIHECTRNHTSSMLESEKVRIIGIERNKTFFVVKEDTVLQSRDLLYFYGDPDAIRTLSAKLETRMLKEIKNIVIFGGDTLGVEIAESLYEPGVTIKLVEHDLQKCKLAAEKLQWRAMVINGKYGDNRFFEEEGLKNADMLIASTKNDEENIIKCLEAREYGIERVIAINNEVAYYHLMHKLGIIVVRGVKNIAYYSIIEKINSNALAYGRLFCGGSGVAYTRAIYPTSTLIGKKVSPFSHPKCLCMLLRDGALTPLDKPLQGLQSGDMLLAFCHIEIDDKVKKWMQTL